MKNFIILCALLLLVYRVGFAQVITVSNQPDSPGQFTNLQTAIDSANPGDTLYVHGSPNSYGNITVDKRLTFIGPGFNPQGQFTSIANINSITLDSIVPTSSGFGSRFIGLYISNIYKNTIGFHQIDNIIFERCRIASGNLVSYVCGNNWVFKNCLFSWTQGGALNLGAYNNIVISNNFFSFGTLNYTNYAAIVNSNKSSVIINNNIFTGYFSGPSFDNVSNAQISNNIFYGKWPSGATSSVYTNNLSYASASTQLPPAGNSGLNNIVNQDPLFVYLPISTFTFNYSYDYHLQPASPGHNAGTDYTDIGIFGGAFPMPPFGAFTITGHPRLPQVYFLHLQNNVISLNAPLGITVKARRFDSSPIYTAEYFYDVDPGVGHAIPLPQFTPTNDTTINLQLSTNNGLQPGHHWVYIRFKDTQGKWGLHARMDFLSCNNFALAGFAADSVCLGDSTSFTNLSTGGDANTTYSWDFTDDGVDDMIHTGILGVGAPLHFKWFFNTGGVHIVRLITNNGGGCADTIFKQVLVKAYPPVPTPTGTTNLCANSPNTVYTIPQLPDATSYYWTLFPPNAGSLVVLPGDTAIEVNWDNNFAGVAQIKAGAAYGACNSTPSAPASVPLNVIISAPSVGGTISVIDSTICLGSSTGIMTLSGFNGSVLGWEKRCNGGLWTPIMALTTTYSEIPEFSFVCEYRVKVKNGACDSAYSAIATITISNLPAAAGTITGPDSVCTGQTGVIYCVPLDTNASYYIWNLPMGTTIAAGSGTNCITVNFASNAHSGNISVYEGNICGNGAPSTPLGVYVGIGPMIQIGSIIQPTCTLATGSIEMDVLSSGNWTINPGNITGTGSDTTISGLAPGHYCFTVTDQAGCTSDPDCDYIYSPPSGPPTPTVTLNGNILHSDAATGNQWYNQNGSINGATGQNYTVITDGYYYDIVTLSGCSSDTSAVIHVIVSGIEKTDGNMNIKIYPNPVTDELVIEIPGNNEKLNFEIINSIGQIVFKGSLFDKTVVQTKNFASGSYLFKLDKLPDGQTGRKTFEFRKL